MYQTVIFSFKVSQNFIVYESAEDRNLRAIFNRVKMHYLAIFLPNSIATRMPYLPAKDELVSLDRLSSRGLWKWYNSKGFGPATTWRGAAFHFLAAFSKMKILWKLWLWFSKMFHQRVRSDWKWSISKFQFWQRILDIAGRVCFFSKMNLRQENHSKLCFTARIITKYSLERFLSFCGEKMSKGCLKFCKLISNLLLGQIIVSNLTNVHKVNSRINYARLY